MIHAPTNNFGFRNYRVRLTRMDDHPVLIMIGKAGDRVLIERSDGARRVFAPFRYWEDTDAWADWRWREADRRGEPCDIDHNMSVKLQIWSMVWRSSKAFDAAPAKVGAPQR
jgi:hypothetical protein